MVPKVLLVLAILVIGLWANNTSMFVDASGETRLIAHRGVHQIYTGENRTSKTCRAESVQPLQHSFIENTLASMRAAFEYGADVVEIDVHLTTDHVLAVFHDWRLECQTDGVGVTHKQTFEYLRKLDLGYGFTADGKTYPLRGSGVGQLPDLESVLDADLAGKILVNFKSPYAIDGHRFVELLHTSARKEKVFGVYGGASQPTRAATDRLGTLKGFDRAALKSCLVSYLLTGWTGKVPAKCKNSIVAVPINYGPWLWGWPHKFTDRMKAVNTEVILLGPYDGTGFTSGVDDVETLSKVPAQFDGYIWTNRIELIGPLVTQ